MGSNSRPVGVKTTLRVVRSKRRRPTISSICWTMRLSAGCDTPCSRAASLKLPLRASCTKADNCWGDRLMRMGYKYIGCRYS